MVVASGAGERQAEQRLRSGVDDVVELIVAIGQRIRRFVIPMPQAVVAGRDRGFGRGVIQFVARQLLDQEAIVRLVRIQRADHVVAITPGMFE